MGDFFLLLLSLLVLLAVFLRDPFVFTLVYILAGSYALARWWSARALAGLRFERQFTPRAFPGETVGVRLHLRNTGLLPIVWLYVSESLPHELSRGKNIREVVTLGPRASTRIEYQVHPGSRGYHRLGPVLLRLGDVLGIFEELDRRGEPEFLIVYPEIVPLPAVRIPSWSPLGQIRDPLPIFADPARTVGKRPYQAGDSLRGVDWKATAAAGSLQVRLLEPSVALQAKIVLNFDEADYRGRTRIEDGELAVVVCASLANWVVARKESAGFATNGLDPQAGDRPCMPVPAGSGRGQLMRVLETLARVRLGETEPYEMLVRTEVVHLPWGSALILVTPVAGQAIFDEIIAARRRGARVLLVLCGPSPQAGEIRRKARSLGIAFAYFQRRSDLEAWR
jgi:uncharacterized protein (DUF58 family)